jgi:circadian clock protein KaiB
MSDPSEETVLETTEIDDAAEAFEQTLAAQGNEPYTLRLYVAGTTPKSLRAIANLKKICEDHLHGRYDLEVIDIYQQPRLVQGDQIIAVPTLVKKRPLPLRKLVGDMSDTDRVLVGLDVRPRSAHKGPP